MQRTAPQSQFAIVSIWKNQAAYDAHMAAAHTKDFRTKNKPSLISAIDDRIHNGMEIAATDAKIAPGAIFVVTHVDVPPPRKDECIAALNPLADASRKAGGNQRFEVQQQTSRPNHFTVVEVWKDRKAYAGSRSADAQRQFRDKLGPMLGALYDERLYRVVE
jgi:quinol monooxygenase YgiN